MNIEELETVLNNESRKDFKRCQVVNWKRTTLSQVSTIVMGQSPPGSTYNLVGQGLPFFQGVKDFGSRHPTERMYCTASTRIASTGDILFSVRAPIGRINRANQKCAVGRGLSVIRAKSKPDTNFIEFVLRNMHRSWVVYDSQGAIFGNVRRRDLEDIEIIWPPSQVRIRIASILSIYDDLIENNRRRIQLLEQAARLLYKEWFVHLRFPGHQHTTITNGVPEGWSKLTIREKATIVRGKSYKSSDLTESAGKPFVNLKCIARHGGFRLDGLKSFSGKHRGDQVVCPGDIVIAVTDMTQNRHIVAHAARIPKAVSEQAVFSMDTVKIIPDATVDKRWFYFFLRYSDFSNEVREHATGTNVLHLKPKQIEDYEFSCPTYSLQKQFGKSAQSILDQQDNLTIQNQKLATARDLILPRLMNGEIAV